jgi:hypothetical protein
MDVDQPSETTVITQDSTNTEVVATLADPAPVEEPLSVCIDFKP